MEKEIYDAIIIGSGIGGLSCGASLAKNGLKVIVLEQNREIGGCCSSFKRDGFIFDLGAVFLVESNLLLQNLKDLGVENKIELIDIDPLYEFIFPDFRIKVPRNMEKFLEKLIQIAPEEGKNLNKFFDEIANVHNIINDMRLGTNEKYNMLSKIIKNPNIIIKLAKYSKMNWKQFLHKYFKNEKLKAILSMECIFLGYPPSKIPMFVMASIISMEHKYGIVYPKGGMIKIAEAYVYAIKKFNGDIRLEARAAKIIIKDKTFKCVELSNGEKIFSKIVVSNAEIRETYFNLIGREYLDKKFIEKIDQLEDSLSVFRLCIGADIELDTESSTIKCPGYDIENIFEKIWRNGISDDNFYLMFIPSLLEKNMANKNNNKQNIHILVVVPYESSINSSKEITKYKNKIMYDVNKIIPDISKHILFISIITPKMLEEMTVRRHGVVDIHEKILDKIANNRTPIKNIYFVGGSAYPGGGVNNTILSGMLTANIILKDKNWRK